MNTTRIHIIGLLMALATFLWTSCSDDELYRSNELGSRLEEMGDFKLSSFTLEKGIWEIADTIQQIKIHLKSHTDDSTRAYDAAVLHSESNPSYSIYIPKTDEIPDSDYDLTAFLMDGTKLGTKLKVTFRDEMLHTIMASTVQYDLEGEGTAEEPYLIGSQEDFSMLEYGLSRYDTIAHAAGLYFRQTADFEAPRRSDVYDGRYTQGESFAGIYDGDGKSITIAYLGAQAESDTTVGLFSTLYDGAQINNLTLKANIQGIKKSGGALAGSSQGNVTLTNVTVSGSITDCDEYIGAFIGYATGNLTANQCRLFASVHAKNYAGGLVGYMENGMLTVTDFSNLQENSMPFLFTVHAGNRGTGGIIGGIMKGGCAFKDITLQHSIEKEDSGLKVIYAGADRAGGLVGEMTLNEASSLNNINVWAPVRSEQKDAGGLVGTATLTAPLSVSNCTFASLVKSNEKAAGFFGYLKCDNHLNLADTNQVVQVNNGYLNVEANKYAGGMFGYVYGDIKTSGLCLININVTATSNFAGGIIGELEHGTLETKNFSLDNDMQVYGNDAAGGLVGYANSSTIKGDIGDLNFSSIPSPDSFKSNYSGKVSSPGADGKGTSMGGIVGYALHSHLDHLCFTGSVFGSDRVGGIVGHIRGTASITHCVNNANIVENSTNTCTGGIAGKVDFTDGTYTHMINYGNIAGMEQTGGIFGYIGLETSTTHNLNIQYAVNAGEVSGSQNVGGCVGRLYDDMNDVEHKISYCANYGKVSNSGNGNLGGILGQGDSKKMVVMNSANHGEIAGGSNGASQVGGIAGRMGKDPGGVTIGNNMELAYCCNRGNISSDNVDSHVGGILGYQEEGNDYDENHWMTHDCYNSGSITSDQKSDNGGIVGCVDSYSEVVRCINIGKVSPNGNGVVGTRKSSAIWHHHDLYYLDGTGGGWCAESFSDSEKKSTSTFNNFDFSGKGVWIIDSDNSKNNGFPYLRDCPFQSIYQ
ncbi:hypothetical protein [Parabacteroides sp.]